MAHQTGTAARPARAQSERPVLLSEAGAEQSATEPVPGAPRGRAWQTELSDTEVMMLMT